MVSIKKIIHSSFHGIYLILGYIICRIFMLYWALRDKLCPPKEKSVLFVAHPDDDTLFFHTFIKEHKPYVVLMTAGWSLRRLPCFMKAMKWYGVRYRAFDMKTKDKRNKLLYSRIKGVLNNNNFECCATHNRAGEYGHEMHIRVHNAVCANASIPIYTPALVEEIGQHPLRDTIIKEKEYIFNNIYTTENWVLEENVLWVKNEYLKTDCKDD